MTDQVPVCLSHTLSSSGIILSPKICNCDSCKFDRPSLTPQIEVANDDKGYYLFEAVVSCKLQNSILVTSDEVDANLQNPKGIAFKFSMITFAPE